MAGHSKFKNIQFRKDRQDKLRSKLFSKLSRDITLAARGGVPDVTANSRLRLAVANAKAESMPKDNIDRAIKKAAGGEADTMEEIRYEGFGPGGVGLIVEVLTDNRNRAAANVRTIFGKNGGNMGESGSVSFMFERVGQIIYPAKAAGEEAMLEGAIEAGAQDVSSDEETHEVITALEDLSDVASALEETFGPPKSTAIIWKPKTLTPTDSDAATGVMRLIDALDDDDDVQSVYTNADISDEDMERLNAA